MNDRYARYLASMQWRKKRDAVMKRSKGMCEMECGRQATQVHHIKYPKQLGDEPITDLLAVCRQCHEKGHGMIERNRNNLVLTFEGVDIRCVVVDDSEPLFPFSDVEASVFRNEQERSGAGRLESRRGLKKQMREGRHWEDRGGVEYLTEAGIYRWAQIFPRPSVWRDDAILWRFSDWVEDTCKNVRTGNVAIVEVAGNVDTRHPELMQAMSLLAAHQAREVQRVDNIEKSIATNRDPKEFITVRQGCSELAYDASDVPKPPDRRTLDQHAGAVLAEAVRTGRIEVGAKRSMRLPDSGHMTTVNTYERAHVYLALRRIQES